LAYANDIKYNGYWYRSRTFKETLVTALAFFCIASLFVLNPIILGVYAEENSNNSIVVVKEQGSYVDSLGRLNIVGVVDNN
jgi:hypothetical protein